MMCPRTTGSSALMKPTVYVQCLSHYSTLILQEFSVKLGDTSFIMIWLLQLRNKLSTVKDIYVHRVVPHSSAGHLGNGLFLILTLIPRWDQQRGHLNVYWLTWPKAQLGLWAQTLTIAFLLRVSLLFGVRLPIMNTTRQRSKQRSTRHLWHTEVTCVFLSAVYCTHKGPPRF